MASGWRPDDVRMTSGWRPDGVRWWLPRLPVRGGLSSGACELPQDAGSVGPTSRGIDFRLQAIAAHAISAGSGRARSGSGRTRRGPAGLRPVECHRSRVFGPVQPGFPWWDDTRRAWRSAGHTVVSLQWSQSCPALRRTVPTRLPRPRAGPFVRMGCAVRRNRSLQPFAELHRGMIGERTSAGMAQKRAQGMHLGRRTSLPATALERIRAERAAGHSRAVIGRRLTCELIRAGRVPDSSCDRNGRTATTESGRCRRCSPPARQPDAHASRPRDSQSAGIVLMVITGVIRVLRRPLGDSTLSSLATHH